MWDSGIPWKIDHERWFTDAVFGFPVLRWIVEQANRLKSLVSRRLCSIKSIYLSQIEHDPRPPPGCPSE